MIEKLSVAIVGYGHLGSGLTSYLDERQVPIRAIIETDKLKRDAINLSCIEVIPSIETIPEKLVKDIDLIIDCSTKRNGAKNKPIYKELGKPAIYQNGENIDVGTLYYPGYYIGDEPTRDMRIPCCSAISILRLLQALNDARLPKPTSATSFNVKTSNDMTTSMVSIDYVSGQEITALTGIHSRTNRVYLRGEPNDNKYVYAASVSLNFKKNKVPEETDIIEAFSSRNDISLVDQTVETTSYPRTINTVIIEESVQIDRRLGILSIALISFPPEIDFPPNYAAIELHRQYKIRNKSNKI